MTRLATTKLITIMLFWDDLFMAGGLIIYPDTLVGNFKVSDYIDCVFSANVPTGNDGECIKFDGWAAVSGIMAGGHSG